VKLPQQPPTSNWQLSSPLIAHAGLSNALPERRLEPLQPADVAVEILPQTLQSVISTTQSFTSTPNSVTMDTTPTVARTTSAAHCLEIVDVFKSPVTFKPPAVFLHCAGYC